MSAPAEEIRSRWARAQALMEPAGLDALLITDKYNYWYFTGYQSREFDKKMRPMLFVLPRDGDPVAIGYRQTERALRRTAGDIGFRGYEDVPFPPELLIETLRDLGLASARVGMEYGENERLGLAMIHLQATQAALLSMQLVDASDILAEMRMIKSPWEVAQIRTACDLSLAAWGRAVAAFAPGQPASAFGALLAAEFARAGVDYNVAGHISLEPAGRPLVDGDVLWCDFGGVWEGYQADLARRMSIGRPDAARLAEHAQICEILAEEIASIGPGKRACDVARIVSDALVARGHPAIGPKKRVGHGLGLCAAEAPSLGLSDTTELRPGMVLTPEPRFNTPAWRVHVEEVIVVTETGCEMLSRGADRLHVAGEG